MNNQEAFQQILQQIEKDQWSWDLDRSLCFIDESQKTDFIQSTLIPCLNLYIEEHTKNVEDINQMIDPRFCLSINKNIPLLQKYTNKKLKLVQILSYVRKRIHFIRRMLKQWEYEYYGLEKPTVSDTLYDLKLRELKDLETFFPQFQTLASSTKNVGGVINSRFAKALHSSPMLSLDNAFSLDELKEFDNYIKKTLGNSNELTYTIEPKFDGLSMALIYTGGKLTKGITRGNGKIGEDVSQNVLVIDDIPQQINTSINELEVRGEIYLNYEQFAKINEAISDPAKQFVNPRNAAAGTIHRLNPQLVKDRQLKFVAYYIPNDLQRKQLKLFTQSDVINYLKKLGFRTASEFWVCKGINEAYSKIQYLESHQNELDYPIDGGVVKLNQIDKYEQVGTTSKFPHWAIAYKFIPKEAITQILDIIPSVGRTGKITYVAKLQPVHLSGSMISSATLNNAEYIKAKDIRIGDYVKLIKAAEIIPFIKEPILDKRTSQCKEYQPLEICPVCGSKLEKLPDEVDQYCVNISCPARIEQSIIWFCAKPAMDIVGLSEKTIHKYYENGYIKTIPDIYRLNDKRIEIVKNLWNNNFLVFNKVINAINQSKQNSLERLLVGLGIRDVGSVMALSLAKHYQNIDNIANVSEEELTQLNDIGPIVAKSIYDWFHTPANVELIKELKSLGLNMEYKGSTIALKNKSSPYYQKVFCITGSFDIPRENIKKKLIELYDIKYTNNLTKSTDYLIAGDNAGSKIKKAQEWNIKIINEKIWEK